MARRAARGALSRLHEEGGFTLMEITVVLSVLLVVLAIFTTALTLGQSTLNGQIDRSQSNDQARLAVEQMDREIRSGNLLYDPKNESPAWTSIRVYTQSNAELHNPGNRCVQWRIQTGVLQRRDWYTNQSGQQVIDGWRNIADHIVNQPSQHPFTLDTTTLFGSRTVIIDLFVNENPKTASTIEVKESITGRNTEFGYPSQVCSPPPPP